MVYYPTDCRNGSLAIHKGGDSYALALIEVKNRKVAEMNSNVSRAELRKVLSDASMPLQREMIRELL